MSLHAATYIKILIVFVLFILLHINTVNISAENPEPYPSIELIDLVKFCSIPETFSSNIQSWFLGSEKGSPINWMTETTAWDNKENLFVREGKVVVTIDGRPTYVLNKKKRVPFFWDLTLLGTQAGVQKVRISSGIHTYEMFFVDFEAGLRNHNITFKLYACGCEKRIYEIKIHSKKRIWLKFALSCGKAGCLWELEMFFSKPDISKNSGLTTNCHTAQVQTSTRALSSKPTFTPKFKVPGKYKEASTRYLTSADLEKKSAWELRVMRNEIFARYYYIFKTTPMRNYFIQQPWYIPLYNDVSSKLTDIELANIKLIQKYEKKISK